MTFRIGNPLALLVTLLLATACGGGSSFKSSAASVSTMTATPVRYGSTMTVTVFGTGLTQTTVNLIIEGPCSTVTAVTGGTDLQQQYTCVVNGLGDLIPRVRTSEGIELASMRLNVPVPQVSISVSQAATSTQAARSGTFVLELDPVAAPITVTNFLTYVRGSFYTNMLFHRVVPDFVVQAGGYTAGPTAKTSPIPAIVSEASNGLKNVRGTVAMARTNAANSATSQFFINLVDNPTLDYDAANNVVGYAVFGKVISGQDVIDEIGKVPTTSDLVSGLTNLPLTNVLITAATQLK